MAAAASSAPAGFPVGVLLRVRPNPSSRPPTLAVNPENKSVTLPQNRTFTFNGVYGSESTQSQIWDRVQSVVDGVLDGFNGTILAYGQTSSGKTYTMLGPDWELGAQPETHGVIPRAVSHIFARIQNLSAEEPDLEYAVSVSFLEIYQEQVRDLLVKADGSAVRELSIRQNKIGAMSVCGLLQIPVADVSKALSVLQQGTIARTTGDTQMNEKSSRSHAVFTVTLEQRTVVPLGQKSRVLRISKLSLVDLAGSERLKRTGAEGIRFKESIKINTGLLALGNVISTLSSDAGHGRNGHIPYRESKLTRLLEDSLGGNAKTVMIACVSPSAQDLDETLNTLKYAHRARKIKNRPIINVVSQPEENENVDVDGDEGDEEEDESADEEPHEPEVAPAAEKELSGTDTEDDGWVRNVVEEFRVRTGKGLRAQKQLAIATDECRALNLRVQALEQSLRDAQAVIAELHATSEESDEHNAKRLASFESHACSLEEELQTQGKHRDSLVARINELELELNKVQNTQSVLTTDINVTVDTLLAVMNGNDVTTLGEDAKGVRADKFPSRPPSSASTASTSVLQRRRVRKVSFPDQTTASLIDRQHAAIRRLEDELFDKAAEATALKEEVGRFKDVIVPRMEKVNSSLILENENLKQELANTSRSKDGADLEDANGPRSEAEFEDLRTENAKLRKELDDLTPPTELLTLNHRLQTEVERLGEEASVLRQELDALTATHDVLEENHTLKADMQQLYDDLAKRTLNNSGVDAEVADLRVDIEAMRLECSRQVDLRGIAEQRVTVVLKENEELGHEIERMRAQLDQSGSAGGQTGEPEENRDDIRQFTVDDEQNQEGPLKTDAAEDPTSEKSFIEHTQADERGTSLASSADEGDFPVHVSDPHDSQPTILSPLPQASSCTGDPPAESANAVPQSPSIAHMRRDLASANRAKVEMARELRDAHREMDRLRQTHSHQEQKFARELSSTRDALAKLTATLEDKEAAHAKHKADDDRRAKLAEAAAAKLKARIKELTRAGGERDAAEKRCAELRDEVARCEVKIAGLKKKLKEESEKLAESEIKRVKETSIMKKQQEEDSRRIKVLLTQLDVLKKKADRSHSAKTPTASAPPGPPKPDDTRATTDEIGSLKVQEEPDLVQQVEDMKGMIGIRTEELDTFKTYHALSKHLRQVRSAVAQLTTDLAEGEAILADLPADDPMREQVRDRVDELAREREKGLKEAEAAARERKVVEERLKEQERAAGANGTSSRRVSGSRPTNLASSATSHTQTDNLPAVAPEPSATKDLERYRATNKALKAKLREVVAVNHKLAAAIDKERNASGGG
ncbi:Kinesin-like protein kif21b [Geranomyces variabilis]|uniref:Kinesin-like protein kif21b n=1 Tax=Geranomyces variabilis TaxID=109894 RepID=A0AAD5XJ11_9FUNG|nr:Kinesin-like protein kif21b [Geranomyces variabilis]